jgi:phage recombination protein Bet
MIMNHLQLTGKREQNNMEEKSLEKYGMDREIKVTEDQLRLVKSVIFPDSTDDELKLFVYECQRRGVHPLDRKIYPIKRSVGESGEKRVTFQTSIDYMRSESESSNTSAGIDQPEYGPEGKEGYPEWAKITVYKWVSDPGGQFHRTPFTGIARWKEYYPGEKLGFMWRKMPHHMLAKCAEAIARRLAWPQRFDHLYIPEETSTGASPSACPPETYTETVKQVSKEKEKEKEKPQSPTSGKNRLGMGKAAPKDEIPEKFVKPLLCTENPRTCDYSAWEQTDNGLIALCIDEKRGKPRGECPYPIQITKGGKND